MTRDAFNAGSLLGSSEISRRNSFIDITQSLAKQSHSEVLADFRMGEKNLIISTAVAEEGIDVQACGSVVRWDLPQNMVSWTQSRGRARRKRSSFILMLRESGSSTELIKKWENTEHEMVQKYVEERQFLESIGEKEKEVEEDEDNSGHLEFRVEKTG